ncbi:DUF885 domain-containing protein [Enhygromyxa salina]|uniref:DUF885 domain-containing protein n=1 Tax=Enhygromyxa salina TaxID=215803 RepID=A0A2S9XS42_9BACT|nr:DUF885 domain-containing protein [Enhygromyxa salina]PRP95678.1 hypothetical protein ENSA7_73120 [Enhygromyxa salina]
MIRSARMIRATLALCPVVLAACVTRPRVQDTPPPPPEPTITPEPPVELSVDAQFFETASQLLDDYFDAYPLRAVTLGLHKYDGRVRDCSADGLAAEINRLKIALELLRSFEPAELGARAQVEQAALISTFDGELFELEVRRAPWRNPMFYMADVELTPYISRSYAPLSARAQAVGDAARAGVTHLEQAQLNLEDYLPRPFVETALMQVRGTISFVEVDVPLALGGLSQADQGKLDEALAALASALRGYEAFLLERQGSATDEFALGADGLLEMLARTQGIELDLATLTRMAEADLDRNLALVEAAAKQIAPRKSVAQVMASVTADKPAPDQVLAEATQQAASARQFLIDHELVTIPNAGAGAGAGADAIVEVVETPPFMRWNSAFLDAAGPFEQTSLPSFYYISPPDPAWPAEQQRTYIPGRTDLLFITVHEVWPGHFLHSLHVAHNESHILQSLWNFTTGEGWAHYTEQMMLEQGLSDDPRVQLGQLQNALLRDVRFIAALGLHAQGMSLDTATELFETKAFQDPVNARQQAVRGTFDPMYLGYTLGKLMILDLREAWLLEQRAAGADDSLRRFHDDLLSHAAAPLPAIRSSMLRSGAK